MMRDAKIGKRDGMVLTGGLLLTYCAAAILYAEKIRATSDFCPDGSWVLISNTCYTIWKLLLPFVLIGAGLLVVGLTVFRGKPERLEQYLHHGTGSHFTLALLVSLVLLPLVFLLVQLFRQRSLDTVFVVDIYDVPYKHTFLLSLAILAGLLMLVPYLGAYIATVVRRRHFLAAAVEPEPEVADEAAWERPTYDEPAEAWPGSRDEQEPEPEMEPVAETQPPVKAPRPAPAPPAASYQGYAGKNRDVEDLEGIGPVYAAQLREAGVRTTRRLCAADSAELAAASGIGQKHIDVWQAMAELTMVTGIGPQYAEVLARSGMTSIAELKRRSAKALAKQVNDYLGSLENNVLGNVITETRVEGWKDAAKGMRKTRMKVPKD